MGEPTKGEAAARPTNNEQPSRWWIAYHLWGGICLKTYLDVSGLTKLFLGAPSGSDRRRERRLICPPYRIGQLFRRRDWTRTRIAHLK